MEVPHLKNTASDVTRVPVVLNVVLPCLVPALGRKNFFYVYVSRVAKQKCHQSLWRNRADRCTVLRNVGSPNEKGSGCLVYQLT